MQTTTANSIEQDSQAVHAVRTGDAERYRELVERHERRVYAVAWSRLGDAALAEEVTQEAFIRAYRRLWMLGDGAKFAGWINSIARNIAINFGIRHRRELNKRERWAMEQEPAPALPTLPGNVEVTEAPITAETLRQTLAELPDAHRECLVLFYLEGKSGAEAAAALGISETALRVRLHRARAALRERLEERLAESLRKLGAAKTLVPVIMASVLATSSAQAATAGGGAALLGTLAKLSPFKWLVPFSAALIGALPGMALSTLAAKAEQRNFRDPDGFRAQANRAMQRRILWLVPLLVIPLVVGTLALIRTLGQARADWMLAVVMVGGFAWAWRFQSGMLVWYGMMAGAMVLKAAGLVSAQVLPWFIIASFLWMMWAVRRQPTRMDNSLFLRAMMGMLAPAPTTRQASTPTTRLEKAELNRFGKFLAERHLTNSFRWRPEGLLLRQTFPKLPWPATQAAQFKAALPFAPQDSSNVMLQWNGEVTAQFSENDHRSPRTLKPEEAELRKRVEIQVAAAVAQAWHDFREGNTAAADRALGEVADSEIFHVPPARAAAMRWRQASLGLVVLYFLGMMLVGQYPQLLKPFFRHRPKRTTSPTITTNTAARPEAVQPTPANEMMKQAFPATNATPATGQLHPSKYPQPAME